MLDKFMESMFGFTKRKPLKFSREDEMDFDDLRKSSKLFRLKNILFLH